jgi:heme oxygenase
LTITPPVVERGVIDRIRRATAGAHARVDAFVDLESMDRRRYVAFLSALHDAHAAVEPGLLARADAIAQHGYDVARRLRSPRLEADLVALCPEWRAASQAPTPVAWLDTDAAAFGAIYVIEGASLGGAVIARHVVPMLALAPPVGCRHIIGDGPLTGAEWRAVREVIERFGTAHGPGAVEAMCDGALATFDCVERALRTHLA